MMHGAPGAASAEGTASAVLILIPLRLGIREINEIYHPKLLQALESPLSVGILGGRPRQSLYFLGYQEDKLIGLDPHLCRLALDVNNPATPLLVCYQRYLFSSTVSLVLLTFDCAVLPLHFAAQAGSLWRRSVLGLGIFMPRRSGAELLLGILRGTGV